MGSHFHTMFNMAWHKVIAVKEFVLNIGNECACSGHESRHNKSMRQHRNSCQMEGVESCAVQFPSPCKYSVTRCKCFSGWPSTIGHNRSQKPKCQKRRMWQVVNVYPHTNISGKETRLESKSLYRKTQSICGSITAQLSRLMP